MNEERDSEPKLIQYLLDKEEIVLPTFCLKQKMILELENTLRRGMPFLVSKFFKGVNENFDDYISVEAINKLFKKIEELSNNEKFQQKISEDDKKIIEFLSKNQNLNSSDFLKILGQEYFTIQVVEELEKTDNLPNILKIPLIMWLFLNLYELILFNVDRRLFEYLKNTDKKDDEDIRRFLKINRENKDHAMPENINKILTKILDLKEENNSIFGRISKAKLIRNKIAHANLFYDSEKNKLVSSNLEEYSAEDFLKGYYTLFNFLIELNKAQLGGKIDAKILIDSLKKMFHDLSSQYLRIERAGLRKEFYSYIIILKKETGINND